MKRSIRIFFQALFFLLLISFCSSCVVSGSKCLDANRYPQRIVSCMPSLTEMLYAIGAGEQVVGVTLNCSYPPEAARKPKVGRERMNVEKIVSLQPDLVVMLQSAQAKDIALLKKQGLPVLVVNPNTIEEVMSTLLYLGKITGHAQPARAVVKKMRERLKKVIQKANAAPPARLVVIIGNNPLVLAGPGTFIDDIVAVAGGKNLAAEARVAWPQYSLEMLVKQDPEVIIVAKSVVNDEKEIYNDRCWQSIRAVKNNRVFLIDADLISRPGSRLVEAVEAIANFLQH